MRASWAPSASAAAITARGNLLRRVRAFFDHHGVTEVVTPVMSAAGTVDPNIDSYAVAGDSAAHWLQTSPEFPMKRLLAAGSGSIYQICPVFRRGESGRLHNPEFQMLEWYRPGFDHHALMDELTRLLVSAANNPVLRRTPLRLTYGEAVVRHAGVDPFTANSDDLRQCLQAHGVVHALANETPIDTWLDLVMAAIVIPRLDSERPTLLYDFPASQAALAKVRDASPPVAERFELYAAGIELANGFHELTDAREQAARFAGDRARRTGDSPPIDQCLLDALRAGLPDCAGVALGIDRLLMVDMGARCINEVITFPADRA